MTNDTIKSLASLALKEQCSCLEIDRLGPTNQNGRNPSVGSERELDLPVSLAGIFLQTGYQLLPRKINGSYFDCCICCYISDQSCFITSISPWASSKKLSPQETERISPRRETSWQCTTSKCFFGSLLRRISKLIIAHHIATHIFTAALWQRLV
jgi:hypothetical protein